MLRKKILAEENFFQLLANSASEQRISHKGKLLGLRTNDLLLPILRFPSHSLTFPGNINKDGELQTDSAIKNLILVAT